jgi:hypothetical protein
MLRALDVPKEMETELKSNQIRQICADISLIPLKVTVSILDALPCWEPVLDEGLPKPKQLKLTLSRSSSDAEHIINDVVVPTLVPTPAKDRNAKATKSDDAAIPVYLWDRELSPSLEPRVVKALAGLWKLAWLWWYRHLERDFMHWFMTCYPTVDVELFILHVPGCKKHEAAYRDWLAGMDRLRRSRRSNWWEWSDGSRPYFWRWTPEYVEIIRDGLPIWELNDLPTWFVPQRAVQVPYMHLLVRKKLLIVRQRRYIVYGMVKSLTSLFAIPKGDEDIRLVYDGTKSSLNRAVWAPWFPLPTVESHLRRVEPGTFMGDKILGKCSLILCFTLKCNNTLEWI